MVASPADLPPGFPQWNEQDVEYKDGRDPLGLDTISVDQILPRILPGWVANTRRTRYLSFYLFLLQEFHERGLGTSQTELGNFIRHTEFEFALGVLRHEAGNHCGRGAVGVAGFNRAWGAVTSGAPATPRTAAIPSSASGGYGQFGYRGVLVELGLIALSGEQVNGSTLSYDRLISDRARAIASRYRSDVASTTWYRDYLGGDHDLPIGIMDEVVDAGCLCLLPQHTAERDALLTAITTPGGEHPTEASRSARRKHAMTVVLSAIAQNPRAATELGELRRTIWSLGTAKPDGRVTVFEDWAALIAKEYYAALVGVAWHHLNTIGQTGPHDGWAQPALFDAVRLSASGKLSCLGATIHGADSLTSATYALTVATEEMHPEDVIQEVRKDGRIAASLAGMMVLAQRLAAYDGPPWSETLGLGTRAQSSVARTLRRLREEDHRPFCDVAARLTDELVLRPHEALATAKLGWYNPPMHSFRFRHERGRVYFFRDRDISDRGVGAPRFSALQTMTRDLGLWRDADGGGQVTADGAHMLQGLVA